MRYTFFILLLISTHVFGQPGISQLEARLKTEPDSHKIKLLLEISTAYAEHQPDSAVHYCIRGLKLAEKQNDQYGQAKLLLELGKIHAIHYHGELARKFYNDALLLFRNLRDQDGIARTYDALGLLDEQEHNITAAISDLNKATRFYQDVHDTSHILETYTDLGRAYEQRGENEKALSYYSRVLVQYEYRKERSPHYFMLLEYISHLYEKTGDSHMALKYIEEGVRNSNVIELKDTQVDFLDEEGKIFETEGDKTMALLYYKQELKDAKEIDNPEDQAKALISIAGILKKENAIQCLKDLREALNIAQNLNQPQLKISIYAAIADVYRQEKNYKEALGALDEHQLLLDSLLNTDTAQEIAVLDSSYELESSRKQIGSLQSINSAEKTELRTGYLLLFAVIIIVILLWFYLWKVSRLNRALSKSNQIKDTLFSVIGHDLKGPAASAIQLFTLMETERFTEEETQGLITELKKQTYASFELLTSLFEWGKAQLTGVAVLPITFVTQPVIQKNIDLLKPQATLKNIMITNDVPIDIQIFADPNHFDFIIRNLLSNAIKFTFENGWIDINAQIDKKTNQIIFSVKDTGIGISPKQRQDFLKTNLEVSFGTKGEKGSGLGLLLVKEFLKANKGRIWLGGEEAKGTTFYFSFPGA